MANEFYTLIVVPHAKARFRKFQVPLRLVKTTAIVAGALALALGAGVVHYTSVASEVYELRRLRSENEELRSKTRVYEENAGKLQAKVVQLQGMVNKLGVMAGLEQSLPEPAAGVGGGTNGEAVPPILNPSALTALDRNLTTLTTRSEELHDFYSDQSALLSSTPSIWPVRGYLSATFGNRLDPFTGQRDFHTGIDVSTPIGTAIHAPAEGVVISAGPHGGYGLSLVIDHGYGVVTRYGHMDGFAVKPGQRLRRGDLIGYVGNTGRSTGPHLHYEVWVRDQAQNPIHYILDEYRSFG
ncbi:MAG TPA: peptidoglycan DD-metalloendopeptidase family protein [Vicinamibacteria bacterium]|nr:peptidoglycan DD-metalloendopeptidase family protein [Vicinamibacteria bacterium]